MIQHLNLENFFNPLMEKYPAAVEYFCQWIDSYKLEVGWNALFGPNVKFHHLTFEMQNGILARFELELFNNVDGKGAEIYTAIAVAYPAQIEKLFSELDKGIKISVQKNAQNQSPANDTPGYKPKNYLN